MRCKTCHYSLANLTERRCPECGTAFDPNDATTFEAHRRFWRANPHAQRGYAIIVWLMAACELVTYVQLVEHWWAMFAALVLLAILLCHVAWTFVASLLAWHREE